MENLLSFDISTLLIANTFQSLASVFILLVLRSSIGSSRGYDLWILASFSLLLGTALLGMRGLVPLKLSIYSGNFFILIAPAIMAHSFKKLSKQEYSVFHNYLPVIIGYVVFATVTFLGATLGTRIIVFFFILGLLWLLPALTIALYQVTSSSSETRNVRRFLIAVFVFQGILSFMRSGDAFWYGSAETFGAAGTFANVLVLLAITTLFLVYVAFIALQITLLSEKVREEHQLFNAAIEGTDAGIWDWDMINDTVDFSTQWKNMLGYDDHEIENSFEGWSNLWHPDDVGKIKRTLDDYFAGVSQKYEIIHRLKPKNGNWRWIMTRGKILKDADEEPYRWIGTNIDITDQKEAEHALKESEEKFRTLADMAKVVIAIVADPKGSEYLYVNNEWSRVHGYSKEEAQNLKPADLLAPESRHMVLEHAQKRINGTPVSENYEIKTVAKDGAVKYLDFSSTVINFNNKKAFLTTAIDVTARKKSEDELKKSHLLLKNLTQQVPGVIYQFRYHADGRSYFPYASDNIWDIYEVTPDEVQEDAQKVLSRIHPDDRRKVTQSIIQSFENLEVWEFEYRVILPKKGTRWVSGQAQPEKCKDESVLWHGYINDITDKKIAEQALKESEKRFRILAENMKDVFWLRDAENKKMLYINPAYENVFGRSCDSLYENPNSTFDSIIDEDIPRIKDAFKNYMTNFNNFYSQYRIRKPDGEIRWLNVRAFPVRDNFDNIIYHTGTAVDITELKEKEIKLEESIATKNKFFNIIAHDLKNLFNAIFGFSELLLSGIDEYNKDEIKVFVERINESGKKTFNLLENLLEWSRSQQDSISYNPGHYNLYELVYETYFLVQKNANDKKISINIDVPEDLNIVADSEMLKTVIRNLLSNAIKYTFEKGKISIYGVKAGSQVIIKISDTGIGMDEKTKDCLFKIGKSKSEIGTNGERGTGFGLLLCKEFVDKHDGTIEVKSKLGKGSTFTIKLPIN